MAEREQRWFADWALLPSGLSHNVALTHAGGFFRSITPDSAPAPDDLRLRGLAMPGLADAHSHAYSRALRGRSGHDRSLEGWRARRSALFDALDPIAYYRLARAAFTEMALAGITTVGEFHYLHHDPAGKPYNDPNAMGAALVQAAKEVGIRLTLFDAVYTVDNIMADDQPPTAGPGLRFSDRTAEAWASRVALIGESDHVRLGAGIYSVRTVPLPQIRDIAAVTADTARSGARGRRMPVQVHVSAHMEDNEASLARYRRTPLQLLADEGLVVQSFGAVHGTHLTLRDITALGRVGAGAVFCPTSTRELGHEVGPARELRDAGATLALGSGVNTVIDMFAEARELEMHAQPHLADHGHLSSAILHSTTTHDALGWPDAGLLRVGCRADIAVISLESPRTAAVHPADALWCATSSDVTHVAVEGRMIVHDGHHRLGPAGPLLSAAITPIWEQL